MSPRTPILATKYVKEWHILGDTMGDICEFKNPPIMTYIRPTNIQDRLIKVVLKLIPIPKFLLSPDALVVSHAFGGELFTVNTR